MPVQQVYAYRGNGQQVRLFGGWEHVSPYAQLYPEWA
jgi:hypothetical protein